MSANENDIIFHTLYTKYGKLCLSKAEVAAELNISPSSLNRKLKNNEPLPGHKKSDGKYQFPITEVAKYLRALSKL